MKAWAIRIGAVLVLAYLGVAYYFSGEITAYKVKSFEEILIENKITGYEDANLPPPEEVRISSSDVIIDGWLFMNPKNRQCGVILSHGHTANRMGSIKFSKLFWSRGCHLLMFDARHHGKSSGAFATWGFREKQDLINLLEWFSQKTGLPHGKIALFGSSMGAAIVMQAAPLAPDIAFVAVDSPFRDLNSELKFRGTKLYGKPLLLLYPMAAWIAGKRGNFDTDDVSPLNAARSIQVPVFMTHTKDDEIIPYTDSEEIFAAIPHENKVLHLTDVGGHTSLIRQNPDQFKKWMDQFIEKYAPTFGVQN
ncbi:MAG: alpha/beta hydrolase [Spirochaetia bacterium]|nr:alpha/beta hydrolase [Spirochaetia bacterium]